MKDKFGLDYFSFDVDFFNDEKIQFITARFAEKGENIVVKLLCKLYRNGYCLPWSEDNATLFAETAGKNITAGLVNDVVAELLKRDFFDQIFYTRFHILTGSGIQKRWKGVIQRLKRDVEIPLHHDIKKRNSGIFKEPPEKMAKIPEEQPKIREEIDKGKGKGKLNPAVARARQFEKNIFEDQFFLETACMNNKITTEEFQAAAAEFFSTKISTGECEEWADETDCRRNLLFSLKFFKQRKQNYGNNHTQRGGSKIIKPDKFPTSVQRN